MSGNVFTFEVDTSPMATALMSISGDVKATAGAVVDSTAALVAAEAEGSRQVSQNIASGFFTLIRSQLEQKKATAKSSIDAKSAQLVGEKKAGEAMEVQFIGDFNRIKNRYDRLFTSVNKALKRQISEIDKQVFQIVEKDFRETIRKRLFSVGGAVVSGLEGGQANALLRTSRTKGQVLRLLESIKNYLAKTKLVQQHIASVLGKDQVSAPAEVCLPFIVAELDGAVPGARSYSLKAPLGVADFRFGNEFDSGIGALDLGQTEWEEPTRDFRDRVAQSFFSALDAAQLDARVGSQIKELFDNSQWSVMKGTTL